MNPVRFRFTLRNMFLAVAFAAVVLLIASARLASLRREATAIGDLRRSGMLIDAERADQPAFESKSLESAKRRTTERPRGTSLYWSPSPNAIETAKSATYRGGVEDCEMRDIGQLQHLRRLDIGWNKITDRGAANLSQLRQL